MPLLPWAWFKTAISWWLTSAGLMRFAWILVLILLFPGGQGGVLASTGGLGHRLDLAGCLPMGRSCWMDLLPPEFRPVLLTGHTWARASVAPGPANPSVAPSLPSQRHRAGLDSVRSKADAEILARDVRQDLDSTGLTHIHVLAFHEQVDSRPVRVEFVLVLTQMKRGRWELWLMARNPRVEGKRVRWTQYTITDSLQRGWKSFRHRPNAAEVGEFLKQSRWSSLAEPPFRTVRHEVFPEKWKEVLGFDPREIIGL